MKNVFELLSKINYWYNKPNIDLGFIRQTYADKLRGSLDNRLIKVLVGQRRVGKSYIIRQLIDYLIEDRGVNPQNIFYLNKELFEFDTIKTASDLNDIILYYKQVLKVQSKVYIFIDEVQNIDQWEKLISSMAQHTVDDYEIFLTGSNSNLLSGELATLLSGRYIVFEVYPFSYIEYLEFYNLQNSKESLIQYLETTGLPEIYNLNNADIKQYYFEALLNTVLLKDIMHRYNIRDYVLLEDLFLFLLHNVGSMVSIPSIVKYYKNKNRKADYYTIASYIKYMNEAFIIRECTKQAVKTKELLSGNKKYFLSDLGFKNYLYPNMKRDIAGMLENIVYIHLRNAGFKVSVGQIKSYEIDFIAQKQNLKLYIQVTYLLASNDTIIREFRPLEEINDSFSKYVISMDDFIISNEKGIIHQSIWTFLYNISKM